MHHNWCSFEIFNQVTIGYHLIDCSIETVSHIYLLIVRNYLNFWHQSLLIALGKMNVKWPKAENEISNFKIRTKCWLCNKQHLRTENLASLLETEENEEMNNLKITEQNFEMMLQIQISFRFRIKNSKFCRLKYDPKKND